MPGLKQEELVIVKHNPQGEETWRYTGVVLQRFPHAVLIEAFFNHDDLPFHGILLGSGDRFVEAFFAQRWYNIFEIHDRATDALKGWYCNIARPAVFTDGRIDWVDLALDLLVYPDGKTLLLDEDEFEALGLDTKEQRQAKKAATEIESIFNNSGGKPLTSLFLELSSANTAQSSLVKG